MAAITGSTQSSKSERLKPSGTWSNCLGKPRVLVLIWNITWKISSSYHFKTLIKQTFQGYLHGININTKAVHNKSELLSIIYWDKASTYCLCAWHYTETTVSKSQTGQIIKKHYGWKWLQNKVTLKHRSVELIPVENYFQFWCYWLQH